MDADAGFGFVPAFGVVEADESGGPDVGGCEQGHAVGPAVVDVAQAQVVVVVGSGAFGPVGFDLAFEVEAVAGEVEFAVEAFGFAFQQGDVPCGDFAGLVVDEAEGVDLVLGQAVAVFDVVVRYFRPAEAFRGGDARVSAYDDGVVA